MPLAVNRMLGFAVLWTIGVALSLSSNPNSVRAQGETPGRVPGDVGRGRYLVEEVAKCAECHTPRKANGELDPEAWLQGGPVWIEPVKPIQNWADNVPGLAGLPSFTDEQFERVMEQGMGPEGETIRPPMHIYHMNPADAKAIIAYLKTLPTGHR